MAHTSMGYDPELSKKFAEESSGFVIGRGHSLPVKSEERVKEEWGAEHGRYPDAQELHDAMLSEPPSSAQPAANDPDKAPLSERFKQMTPQQLGKLFDDLM